jgi:hypothetical protein
MLIETAPGPRIGEEFATGAKLHAQPRSVLAFAATT